MRPPPPLRTVRESIPLIRLKQPEKSSLSGKTGYTTDYQGKADSSALTRALSKGRPSVVLPVTRRMRNFQVGPAIRAAINATYTMVYIPAGLFSYRQMAERAVSFLSFPQPK